uniref:Uncharacterized protein n=1 Tax=Romanomermis culicivorax TaxID=13658 RepID=A0A915K5Y7_ROMCU
MSEVKTCWRIASVHGFYDFTRSVTKGKIIQKEESDKHIDSSLKSLFFEIFQKKRQKCLFFTQNALLLLLPLAKGDDDCTLATTTDETTIFSLGLKMPKRTANLVTMLTTSS